MSPSTPSSSPPPPPLEFRFEPALERRDPSSVITALALDDDGGRIYVGTSDGVLEEWNRPLEGGRAILGARRHVGASKKPIAAVSYIGAARKIAALIDGNVLLLDEETLDASPLPAGPGWRSGGSVVAAVGSGNEPSLPLLSPSSSSSNSGGITAIAAAPTGGDVASSSCLALAGRAKGKLLSAVAGGGGSSRAAIFFVVPSSTKSSSPAAVCTHAVEWSEPLAVTTVAWVGANSKRGSGGAVVLGTALRYSLWRLQQPSTSTTAITFPSSAVSPLLELPADSPTATPVALSLPAIPGGAREDDAIPEAALLLVERAGVAVGADGAPARGRPGAATFAEAPDALAIAAGGRAVIAACPSGVSIHDAADLASIPSGSGSTAAARVLPWPEGATPSRGQRLLSASIPAPLNSPPVSNDRSGFALVSGMRKAWALVPVSRSERALSALAAGRASEAAAAALSSLLPETKDKRRPSEGEIEERNSLPREWSWAEDVAAEAGLSLLSRALSLLGDGDAAAAAATAEEASRALSSSSLHPSELFPLSISSSGTGSESSSLLSRWSRAAEGAATAASDERRQRLGRPATAAAKGPSFRLPPPPRLLALPSGLSGDSAAAAAAAVTAAVSEAMLCLRRKNRTRSGSDDDGIRRHLEEGIDSAAVVLAARAFELSAAASSSLPAFPAGAEAEEDEQTEGTSLPLRRLRSLLLSSRNLRASSDVVSCALEAAGAHCLLAEFLSFARGDSVGALRVWREVAEGKRKERKRWKGGDEEECDVVVEAACEAAADLLSDPRTAASAALVAENVPWLLEFGSGSAKKEERKKKQVSSSVFHPSSSSLSLSFPPSPEAVVAEWPLPPAARALISRAKLTSAAAGTKKRTSKGEEGGEEEDTLTAERALLLLPADSAPWARASFLVHLVFGTREGGGDRNGRKSGDKSISNGNETTTAAATELALLLVSISSSLIPPSLLSEGRQFPEWKRAEIVRTWISSKRREAGDGESIVASLARARRALRALLLLSASTAVALDVERVSLALEHTDLLHEEAALVSLIRGDRAASARRLLLVCRDAEAAASVALGGGCFPSSSSLSSSSSSPLLTPDALLSELLDPGQGREPLVEDAAALFECVAAMGVSVAVGGRGGEGGGGKGTTASPSKSTPSVSPAASLPLQLLPPLDASSILDAIGDDVPLSASLSSSSGGGSGETTTTVGALLRRMLRSRVRARRGAAVARGLARAEALEAAAERGSLASRRAAVIFGGGDGAKEGARKKKGGSGSSNATCCRSCGARIGLKVFAVVPSEVTRAKGKITCMRCVRKEEA